MFAAARVVARVTVSDALARARPTSADSQASTAMVETRYQATILEVLKSEDHDIETGVQISIVLPIGQGSTRAGPYTDLNQGT
jgi:hypothetical protein